jgi:glycosyltransferase involved in cell wall biosynthesis
LNELQLQVGNVHLLTSDAIPLLNDGIRVSTIQAEALFWTRPELHQLLQPQALAGGALARSGRVIYQRYGAFNWTGAALSREAELPFVLEFNGPEAWLAEQWGVGLRYPELATRIEQANLEAADLISVVSEPLRQHVLARGIQAERIIVLPNGVDPERFRPDLDGALMRESLGLGGRRAIGFIGTFGPWHGVETFAEAFIRLLRRRPDLSGKVALVDQGWLTPAGVRTCFGAASALGDVVLTGLVPQAEACLSHGMRHSHCPPFPTFRLSLFFGSPAKLFEYMAMGRPIVATSRDRPQGPRVAKTLCGARRVRAMYRALERLIEIGLAAQVRRRARQDMQRHTSTDVWRDYLHIWRNLPARIRS